MSTANVPTLEREIRDLEDGFRSYLYWVSTKRSGESEPAHIRNMLSRYGRNSPSVWGFESELETARNRLRRADPSNPLADHQRTARIKSSIAKAKQASRITSDDLVEFVRECWGVIIGLVVAAIVMGLVTARCQGY
jgi:hypothetical protein